MTGTVLVTGGSGFIAGWCIVGLLDRGYAVRATVRSLSKGEAVRAAVGRAGADTGRLSFVEADLTRDDGWDAVVQGCDYVLHVASPLGGQGESLEDLVKPAREGTLRVLAAATRAKVRRIVVTSSCAAVTPREVLGDTTSDETLWSDLEDPNLDPYRKSKTIAEKAAWAWMEEHDDPSRMTTILPAAVFGPILSREAMSSVALIDGLLNGRPPAIPRIGFNVVDVRDVADLHILAMTTAEAGGQRFIAAGQRMWMADVAEVLRRRLGERARRVPSRRMPDWLVRMLAAFVPRMRTLAPMIGRRHSFSAIKAGRVMGWKARPAVTTIVDCAESLLA